jgi:hypothetical protein
MKHNQKLNMNIAYRTEVMCHIQQGYRLPITRNEDFSHLSTIKRGQNGEKFKKGDVKNTILLNERLSQLFSASNSLISYV